MTDRPALTQYGAVVRLDIRVMPRSPRAGIGGMRHGRLLVRVTAAPVEGAANDAVVAVLAEALDVPRRAVSVVSGRTSRNKTVEVAGTEVAEIEATLSRLVTQ